MANPRFSRGHRDENLDFEARRAAAEGRSGGNHHNFAPRWDGSDQILDDEGRLLACKALLNGELGICPIFDLRLSVEKHSTKGFTLFKIVDMSPDSEMKKFGIRQGFFVPLGTIWQAYQYADFDYRGNVEQEFIIRTLMTKPAMQEAFRAIKVDRRNAYEEQQAAAAAEQEKVRAAMLAELTSKSAHKPATEVVQLAELKDLLTANVGQIVYKGLVLYVAYRPQMEDTVIRIREVLGTEHGLPEAEDICSSRAFAIQSDLVNFGEEDPERPEVFGKALMAERFRQWLRQEGLIPPGSVNVVTVPDLVELVETAANVGETTPKPRRRNVKKASTGSEATVH